MAKYKIITCDLCGGRIYKNGIFEGDFEGSVKISARVLKKDFEAMDKNGNTFLYPGWRRREYYICAKCVKTIKEYCKKQQGGADDD